MPKLLIVDDEPKLRLLLEQVLEELEDEGVEILAASDGEEALSIIKSEKPQLVFLDIMMPKVNGFDVCYTVKNALELKDVFIVLLTAKGQEYDKKRGKEVGADLYITKPFDPEDILQKAREILRLS